MGSIPPKAFIFDKLTVFFKHTDYHGFVHPYNYLEWTSYVREAFFQENVPTFPDILQTETFLPACAGAVFRGRSEPAAGGAAGGGNHSKTLARSGTFRPAHTA